jgi:hypothetical protein
MDTFPSVIQSVTTGGQFSVRNSVGNYRRKYSVGSYRLNYGWKSFRIKKRWVADVEVLAGYFFRRIQNVSPYSDVTGSPFKLPTDSPRDLKWQIRTVTCRCFRQNHRWSFHRWNRQKKLIYDSSADPLLPYFSFFFLIPTLPICKQPAPLPPKKTPSYQHNKLYFLKFCCHSICVLIYRRILSIFVSNSIFLNFNI